MDYGFVLPIRGPLATPEAIATLARRGEELGFAYLGVSDHIVIPKSIASRYPYTETGEFPGRDPGQCLEQLSLLAYVAAVTSRARLLTSVMVLPHRPPLLAAKALATIDLLSGGRVTVGCGVGWLREEFEAIGAPPYDERGQVADEYIAVFRRVWTDTEPAFQGRYCDFSDIAFLPRPVQEPHPPIWVGGESPPALRRAARLGDGWYPIGNNPRYPLDTPELYARAVETLKGLARSYGRDPDDLDLAFNASWYSPGQAQRGRDGARRPFTGAPEDIAADIARYRELGVRHLILNMQADTLEASLRRMEHFAQEVRPLVPAG